MRKGRICKKRYIKCTCGEEYSINGIKTHIKKKHNKITEQDFKDEYYIIMYGHINIKELIELYVSGESTTDLMKQYNLLGHDIQFIFKYNNVYTRTTKESRHTKQYIEKIKNTILEKYGVDNISKSEDIKIKKVNTMLRNYNRINNFCDKDIHDKAKKNIDHEKCWETLQKTLIERYGIDRLTDIPGVKEKIGETTHLNYLSNTVEQKEVIKLRLDNARKLIDYNKVSESLYLNYHLFYSDDRKKEINDNLKNANLLIDYNKIDYNKISEKNYLNYHLFYSEEQKKIINTQLLDARKKSFGSNNISKQEIRIQEILNLFNYEYKANTYIHDYNFDILFNNKHILEVNGDYWHANPKKYKENDIISYPGKKYIIAKDIWNKDERKRKIVEKEGYIVHYIWESDINKMSDIDIINFIITNIGI